MAECAVCGKALASRGRGRPSTYCSRACQARAYRGRKAGESGAVVAGEVDKPRIGVRERLLDTAEDVLLGEGVGHLTLERVAAVAGVSKGGLLHYFPNKLALVRAMIDRLVEQMAIPVDAEPGAAARAFLIGSVEPPHDRRLERVAAALLAAATLDPTLLQPLREWYEAFQRRLEGDGIDPVRATVVRLAADGWFLSRLFGLAPLSEPLAGQVRDHLIEMTRRAPRSG